MNDEYRRRHPRHGHARFRFFSSRTTSAVPQSKRADRLDRWVCLSHTGTRSTRIAGTHFEMDNTAEGRKLSAKATNRGPG
jgi:hypothetical protein